MKSRSDVIEAALSRLQETEREDEMSEAPEEDDLSGMDLGVPNERDEEPR
jgi:Arc/MetJ-type ribon-helix-helix transcriptional regulator